jgi:ankyrin repeat protein
MSPLHHAASSNRLQIVQLLLDRGADVNAKDHNGRTPLHVASLEGEMQVVHALLDRGADINIQTKNGSTPLHDAVCVLHVEYARALLDRGADFHRVDNKGRTPLHFAASSGHLDVVHHLLALELTFFGRTIMECRLCILLPVVESCGFSNSCWTEQEPTVICQSGSMEEQSCIMLPLRET